jgi:hypothetical protein
MWAKDCHKQKQKEHRSTRSDKQNAGKDMLRNTGTVCNVCRSTRCMNITSAARIPNACPTYIVEYASRASCIRIRCWCRCRRGWCWCCSTSFYTRWHIRVATLVCCCYLRTTAGINTSSSTCTLYIFTLHHCSARIDICIELDHCNRTQAAYRRYTFYNTYP